MPPKISLRLSSKKRNITEALINRQAAGVASRPYYLTLNRAVVKSCDDGRGADIRRQVGEIAVQTGHTHLLNHESG